MEAVKIRLTPSRQSSLQSSTIDVIIMIHAPTKLYQDQINIRNPVGIE